MSLSLIEQFAANLSVSVHRLSADQFERMIEAKVLPENGSYELIDGLVTNKDRSDRGGDPMTHGERHASAIELLTELYARLRPLRFYARYQLPIRLSNVSEPEPDGAVLRGEPSRGRGGHPTAAEVAVVFEVSDRSLEYDRTVKLELYASASIPCYVIVNLCDSTIEVHTSPDVVRRAYRERKEFARSETFSINLAEHDVLTLRGEELIP